MKWVVVYKDEQLKQLRGGQDAKRMKKTPTNILHEPISLLFKK